MSPRIARLVCGHERWVPYDWDGGALACAECREDRAVALTTPDFDVMTPPQLQAYMRSRRNIR
jgi:hypothetical protein